LHDPFDPVDGLAHVTGHLRIGTAALKHLDIRCEGAEWVSHLVGDAGGESANPRQLFHPDHLALRVQQVLRHDSIAPRQ
jgi:hypothetical protein